MTGLKAIHPSKLARRSIFEAVSGRILRWGLDRGSARRIRRLDYRWVVGGHPPISRGTGFLNRRLRRPVGWFLNRWALAGMVTVHGYSRNG
ncbi:MAG: hypothetical protein PVH30_07265 [Desulfobacterales bacterium]